MSHPIRNLMILWFGKKLLKRHRAKSTRRNRLNRTYPDTH